MRRITVNLTESEWDALHRLGLFERRGMREQAALIICRALIQDGLLPADTNTNGERKADAPQNEVGHATANV